jgi:hypothetical protein
MGKAIEGSVLGAGDLLLLVSMDSIGLPVKAKALGNGNENTVGARVGT